MSERKEEIRKEDKKWGWKFGLILLASGIGGGFIGGGVIRLTEWLSEAGEGLAWVAGVAVPVAAAVLLALIVLGNLIALPILWGRCKKLEKTGDPEDEAVWEKLDRRLSGILAVTSLSLCVVMTLMGVAVSGFQPILWELDDLILSMAVTLGAVLGLFAELTLVVIFQRLVVNFYKEHNPEKQGSVYQMNFNKVWLKSCDEAEKLHIYQAGYTAYRVGYYTCLALWLLAILGAMAGLQSWANILFVGIIWTAMQAGYLISAAKQKGNGINVTI